MNVRMILTDLDGTLIHRQGEQIYSCNLEICGTGVAVANAVPDVKEAADSITRSNDEDGVAE